MNLAQKLQKLVKKHNEATSNVVYTAMKRRVVREITEEATKGKESSIIKLVGDGERYWKGMLLEYLNGQGLRATMYSFSEAQSAIKITWCD